MSYWVRLRSGRRFHYLNPRQKDICVADIVHSLSVIPRFNGHTRVPYYVAQHVCICHDLAPKHVKKETLGHDNSEYVACDLPSPLKAILPAYKVVETRIEQAIAKRFDLTFPYPPLVKEIDLIVLATEMRDLMGWGDWKDLPYKPMKERIIPWDTARCRREYMKRFRTLYGKAAKHL